MSIQQSSNVINCLTDDEDERQELWVHHLNGGSIESFTAILQKPSNIEDVEKIRKSLFSLLKNPPSDRFQELLSRFSNFERSVMFCLTIGLNTQEIALYKGISEVRIKQCISAIRYNSSWEEIYGVKETPDR